MLVGTLSIKKMLRCRTILRKRKSGRSKYCVYKIGTGLTKKNDLFEKSTTEKGRSLTGLLWNAFLERVSSKTGFTFALRHVVSHDAVRIPGTYSRTAGVDTFEINACLVPPALGAADALWPAPSCRVTPIPRQAGADAVVANHLVICVCSARVRTTGTLRWLWLRLNARCL